MEPTGFIDLDLPTPPAMQSWHTKVYVGKKMYLEKHGVP